MIAFRNLVVWTIFTLLGLVSAASAQTLPSDAQSMRVLTIERPPFAMRDDSGEMTGFSVELWKQIAARLQRPFEIIEETQFSQMLRKIESGQAEAAAANISITAAREDVMDFSLSIYDSGLQILARRDAIEGSMIKALMNSGALEIVGVAVAALMLAAHAMWLLERRVNPDIRSGYVDGVWDAFWWAFMAAAAGDGARPLRPMARLLAMVWVLVGVLTVSSLTASITTLFTVSQLTAGIESYRDLAGKRLGVAKGTTMERFAVENGIAHRVYPDFASTLEALERDEIDATIGDAPVVRYYALNEGAEFATLAGPVFAPDKIGFAFPAGSALRDEVNRALLRIIEEGEYKQLAIKYFGE